MLTFEEFARKMMNGESRSNPGLGVTYILITDDDNNEFYVEWEYVDDDQDDINAADVYDIYLNWEKQ